MFKRVSLFLLTNLAVVALLNVVASLLMRTRLVPQFQHGPLLMMAVVFGFGGSFVSLLISKWMAKRSTGAHVIVQPRNSKEAWLLDVVRRQATQAGIGMPEVAVYDSPEPNAFATGASKNNALVAVSTGLLQRMSDDEVEAVLGHEISHVANGDMVTLTLLQGVLNTFVFFFARIFANVIDSTMRSRDDDSRQSGPGFSYYIIVFVCEMVLGLLASLIVMAFSRYREYRADAGGANLAGRRNMVNALRRLSGDTQEADLPKGLAAFGISGGVSGLLRSHPPMAERIRRLEEMPATGQAKGSRAASY